MLTPIANALAALATNAESAWGWVLVACLVAATAYFITAEVRTRRAWREQEARNAANADSLAYWEAENPELAERAERIWRAGAYRRNFGDSPANQPEPAPWFDGEAS